MSKSTLQVILRQRKTQEQSEFARAQAERPWLRVVRVTYDPLFKHLWNEWWPAETYPDRDNAMLDLAVRKFTDPQSEQVAVNFTTGEMIEIGRVEWCEV